ncbi:mucin TcMUCII, putative, partial [Trypanosoma cruzi]
LLLCVRTLREGCRHDGPLSPYVHAVDPCVPLLFASPSSICVLVLWQGCMCVCACCRGLECVSCVVCGVRCMRGCCPLLVWCALCVCLPHLSSPLLLSMSFTVQISSTPLNDHTHDDDDVPSAVRPVGACPVLLPVRVRGRANREVAASSQTITTTNKTEPSKEDKKEDTSETQKNAKNPSTPVSVGALGSDQSGLPNKDSVGKPVKSAGSGNVDGEEQSLAVTGQNLNKASSTSQAEDNKGTIGLQGDKNISADTQTKSEAPAETTTTTTSAPEAPSTATTEAPTTTTTS